jgi:hypothetical protein
MNQHPRRFPPALGIVAVALLFVTALGTVLAQYGGFGRGGGRRGNRQFYDYQPPPRDIFPDHRFTFCRIQYTSVDGPGRQGQGWAIEYPQADLNLSLRLAELTTIRISLAEDGRPRHVLLRLTDPGLFDYPMIFLSEPGAMALSDAEQSALRSYLLRGGFLHIDDFHGDAEWENVAYELGQVLPPEEYPIVEIPMTHELFHTVFDIKEVPQVPSIHGYDYWLRTGDTVEWRHDYRGGDTAPHCRGIFDSRGRLMVCLTFNTDIGDGWEREGVNEGYFREFSVRKAYPMGINIVVYAMTH